MTKAGRLLGLNDYQHLSRHMREERDGATHAEPNPSLLDGCILVTCGVVARMILWRLSPALARRASCRGSRALSSSRRSPSGEMPQHHTRAS